MKSEIFENTLKEIDKTVVNIANTSKRNVENNFSQKKSENKKWDQSFVNSKKPILSANNQNLINCAMFSRNLL